MKPGNEVNDYWAHPALQTHHRQQHESTRLATAKDGSVDQSVRTEQDDQSWDARVGINLTNEQPKANFLNSDLRNAESLEWVGEFLGHRLRKSTQTYAPNFQKNSMKGEKSDSMSK